MRTVGAFVVLALGLSACGNDSGRFSGPDAAGAGARGLQVAISPSDGTKDVLTSAEISIETDAEVQGVSVTDSGGRGISGDFSTAYGRGEGTWIPNAQLDYSTTYTVKVSAREGDEEDVATSTFTTMKKPKRTYHANVNVGDGLVPDGGTVGVGLPIVVQWSTPISDEHKADIERRMFVDANPPVEGSWHWYNDKRVRFRPKDYWTPGTVVSIRLAYGGLALGSDGPVGVADHVASFTVGSEVIATIDNASHQMTVMQDGVVLRTIPISLGKPRFETPEGSFVVMEKLEHTTFNSESYGLPADDPDGYEDIPIDWAMRLTYGGIFHHSAHWSVQHQGYRNVSHGCINIAPEPAKWFFDLTKIGDLTIISGTGVPAEAGDGWGDWNIPWEEYKQGSALA